MALSKEDLLTPKSPLERIVASASKPNAQQQRATSYDSQSRRIRSRLSETTSRAREMRDNVEREALINSLSTNIRPHEDFSSLSEVGNFLEGLRSSRQATSNLGLPGGAQASFPSGPIDIESLDPDLQWIIQRESGGNPHAQNPTSSAFGIGQLIRANREHYGAQLGIDPNTTDPNEQLQLMMAYIRDRYGTVQAAREFWERNGWY